VVTHFTKHMLQPNEHRTRLGQIVEKSTPIK